jgi:hypothetical protein
MGLKQCRICHEWKPVTDFHRNSKSRDGLQGRCKPCVRAYNREWRARNRDRIATYKWHSSWSPEKRAKWRARTQHKVKAQRAVFEAVKYGRLVRPTTCELCGHEGRIQAHHEDYDQPLVVRWLCAPCHYGIHSGVIAA